MNVTDVNTQIASKLTTTDQSFRCFTYKC